MKGSNMTTKQQLAGQLREALTLKTRDNGQTFWALKDNAPEWMTDAIRACHNNGDKLPNDWRYSFVVDAACALAEAQDWDDLPYPEPDIYNHDLIRWLGEFPNAASYCDEARAEFGGADDNIMTLIQQGQAYAKNETQEALRNFIIWNLSDLEELAGV